MINKPLRIALNHATKVFLYAGVSALIPFVVSYIENDPRWMAFTPVINALLYSARRYFIEAKNGK